MTLHYVSHSEGDIWLLKNQNYMHHSGIAAMNCAAGWMPHNTRITYLSSYS